MNTENKSGGSAVQMAEIWEATTKRHKSRPANGVLQFFLLVKINVNYHDEIMGIN